MTMFSQPKIDELRQQYIENIRTEIQRTTIEKLQQQREAEAAGRYSLKFEMNVYFFFRLIEKLAREASQAKLSVKKDDDNETSTREDNETVTDPDQLEKVTNPDEEQEEGEQQQQQQSQTPVEASSPQPPIPESSSSPAPAESSPPPPPADASSPPPAVPSPLPPQTDVPQEDLRGLGPEDEQTQVEPLGEITVDHPEVIKAVEQAIEEARNATVNVPPDVYAELIHKAIQSVEQEQREKDPNGPL